MKASSIARLIVTLCVLISFAGKISGQIQTIDFFAGPVFVDTIPNNFVPINFNIYDQTQTRISSFNNSPNLSVSIVEYENDRLSSIQPLYVEGSFFNQKLDAPANATATSKSAPGLIPLNQSDLTVSILIDKSGSMTRRRIDVANQAIASLLGQLPDGCAYLSWFDNDVSKSIPVTRESFRNNQIEYIVDPRNKNTALFNAIYMKLQEFDSTSVIINTDNPRLEPFYQRERDIYRRKTSENYLIVLTDGDNDVRSIPKYQDQNAFPDFKVVNRRELFNQIRESSQQNNVKVFTIALIDEEDSVNPISDITTLMMICQSSNNRDGFFVGGNDEINEIFQTQIVDLVRPDYTINLQYIHGKVFDGNRSTFFLKVEDPSSGLSAEGRLNFIKGSKLDPYIIFVDTETSKGQGILKGLGIGLILLLIVLIIIHLIIPMMGNWMFSMKFSTKYKPDKDEGSRQCSWCGSDIKKGQSVVVKCSHIAHEKCWKDYDFQCPEYGLNCNEGKQHHFDINDPLSKRNARNYLNWVVNGMFAGMLIWLSYVLLIKVNIFQDMVGWMVDTFYNPVYTDLRGTEEAVRLESELRFNQAKDVFIGKIYPMMLLGTLAGFFIPIFLLILEESHKFSFKKVALLFLRGIIGALSGFLSFFIGGMLIIALQRLEASYLVDIIPWIIFGPLLGFQIAVKTTIMAKHGVLGGLISIVFSFLILYIFSNVDKSNFVLISIMIYGGGLGGAISTIRKVSENYFLIVVSGDTKLKEIPIHKWLKVYPDIKIGTGKICEIRMDWETPEKVDELHLKMFMDSAKKQPLLVCESSHETTINDRVKMAQFKEYPIFNGDTFKVGDTVFRYDERD